MVEHKRHLSPNKAQQGTREDRPSKRVRTSSREDDAPTWRHAEEIQRPGVPAATSEAELRIADKRTPSFRGSDKNGHHRYDLGDSLTQRYKILSKMGEGTFGRVLECWDRKLKQYVAIKVIRNVRKYRDAALIELRVLNTLQSNDPHGKRHCIALKEWFDFQDHICMVFEKLGPSLFDFLRRNGYRPLPLEVVQTVSHQLLEAVAYMHELSLIHTDLKLENILLQSPDYYKQALSHGSRLGSRVPQSSRVRVIDFGSSTFQDEHHSSVVSTRHYRAPEVILGMGWSFPCDIWSCACIIAELLTGDALFQTHQSLEHLAMMQQVLGAMPEGLLSRCDCEAAAKYFIRDRRDRCDRLFWPDGASSRKSIRAVNKMAPLQEQLAKQADSTVEPHMAVICDLLQSMMQYDPDSRITAEDCLQHDFFKLKLGAAAAAASDEEEAELEAGEPAWREGTERPQPQSTDGEEQEQEQEDGAPQAAAARGGCAASDSAAASGDPAPPVQAEGAAGLDRQKPEEEGAAGADADRAERGEDGGKQPRAQACEGERRRLPASCPQGKRSCRDSLPASKVGEDAVEPAVRGFKRERRTSDAIAT